MSNVFAEKPKENKQVSAKSKEYKSTQKHLPNTSVAPGEKTNADYTGLATLGIITLGGLVYSRKRENE